MDATCVNSSEIHGHNSIKVRHQRCQLDLRQGIYEGEHEVALTGDLLERDIRDRVSDGLLRWLSPPFH